jgi:hypothetical protein
MENEIPAGTKVKVAVTQKGVTTYQDAEVLAHMDGLVHVSMDGEAVSVVPSQIVPPSLENAASADEENPNENGDSSNEESTAAAASGESAAGSARKMGSGATPGRHRR